MNNTNWYNNKFSTKKKQQPVIWYTSRFFLAPYENLIYVYTR